ncbi:glycosyltransferase [Mesorhizobium sp. M0323]|uniref:glycosyltransferase n=1 Tax=Mesorhizobium sp. M0323 TaxID=2956938 RepID=UPI003334AED6
MKVALVTSWLSSAGGGVSTVVEALSRELVALGVEARVFGLSDKAWRAGGHLHWDGAPATAFDISGPDAFGYARKMLDSLIEWSPDVTHIHGMWMYPSVAVSKWANAAQRPYIVSPHGMLDSWAIGNSYWKKRIALGLFQRRHLKRASAIHALCEQEAKSISSLGYCGNIETIPNGVHVQIDEALSQGPFPQSDKKTLLYLGRIHPKKNIAELLFALADPEVIDLFNEWQFVVAGWDQLNYTSSLKDLSKSLNIADFVKFSGPVYAEAKRGALKQATAFVLPSLSEGLPMTILEAWSFGLPVLMTDECNLPKGFSRGAAHRLSLGPSMKDDLKTFLRMTESEMRLMGASGKDLVLTEFQWPTIAGKFQSLYNSIV